MDETKEKPQITRVRRELQRRSLDQIKVYNPLEAPFFTIFDGFTHVCQGRNEAVFPRYIAEKWVREFTDYMITQDEEKAVRTENEKRIKRGQPVLDPQERETLAYRDKLLTNDPNLRMKYMRMVYKGVTSEYGMDIPEPSKDKIDKRPLDDKLFETLDGEFGVVAESKPDPQKLKDDFIKETSDE